MLIASDYLYGKRDWPFKRMSVGETVVFNVPVPHIAKYAIIYGHRSGKRFTTKTLDGNLHVTRTH